MKGCNQKTTLIRKFILENVSSHPTDIVKVVAHTFSISRQAAARHLKKLVKQGDIEIEGNTSGRIYRASKGRRVEYTYSIPDKPFGKTVWRTDILPLLHPLSPSVVELWQYCFEENFNNSVRHSGGKMLKVQIVQRKDRTTITISDDGIGIFQHIKEKLKLENDDNAALQLASSKCPTDPEGNGEANIFRTSRMTNQFTISSKRVALTYRHDMEWDWTLDKPDEDISGTSICMVIDNTTAKTKNRILDECTAAMEANHVVATTCIPVRLVDYSTESFFSRSQARRVLTRIARFKIAILDFLGVKEIGPAFADQVFRVFSSKHPDITLLYTNANKQVETSIQAARKYSTGIA